MYTQISTWEFGLPWRKTHTHLLLLRILLSCGAGHMDAFVLFNLFNPCSLLLWLIWVVRAESDVHDYPLSLEGTSTVRTLKSRLCLTAMLLPEVIIRPALIWPTNTHPGSVHLRLDWVGWVAPSLLCLHTPKVHDKSFFNKPIQPKKKNRKLRKQGQSSCLNSCFVCTFTSHTLQLVRFGDPTELQNVRYNPNSVTKSHLCLFQLIMGSRL